MKAEVYIGKSGYMNVTLKAETPEEAAGLVLNKINSNKTPDCSTTVRVENGVEMSITIYTRKDRQESPVTSVPLAK